ncbi:MAG: penicillin-binding protein 2 [Anaerolineae bacterium]|nr:penicillin-binding protein 2 [Anaerolineae bacterium]MCO5192932.1 penicillin-binding protein 2 [Anaerolineae bacterium]MCO5198456.1 penicillin-binding protein 2 [Anaerolineae bacterium]
MQTASKRRVWVIAIAMIAAMLIVTARLVQLQVVQAEELKQLGDGMRTEVKDTTPERGQILDKNGNIFATSGRDYQLGGVPPWITKPEAERLATALAPILQQPRYEILEKLLLEQQHVRLSDHFFGGRLPAEAVEAIREIDHRALRLEPQPRRLYPQGEMLCHALGFVDFDNIGRSGIEAYYQDELAGEPAYIAQPLSPLYPRTNDTALQGANLVLTVDRTVQRTVETYLREAIDFYDATGGSIIAMDPRTGAILAMADWPCYSPYDFFDYDESLLVSPSLTKHYEPGSVMKLVNMAIALDSGKVSPSTTYDDFGFYEFGDIPIYNADRKSYGTVNMTQVLQWSINTASAWLASLNTPDTFYDYMHRFGFGRTLGVDIAGESGGYVAVPGDPLWTQSNVATNAFGQGIAVTPLQMISAASAIANGGEQMRPYIVQEQQIGERVYVHQPEIMSVPVSRETANQVTAMLVEAAGLGKIDGYTVAGKSGTAQIPEGGVYHPTDTIHSYIGWLPADAPELIILIKLDRVTAVEWGGESAGPTFAKLAEELAVMLNIPPDEIRLQNGQTVAATE